MVLDNRILSAFGAHHRRSFAEQELGHSLEWLIGLRWFAGVGVLLGGPLAAAMLHWAIPAGPIAVIGAGILAYNFAFDRALRQLYAEDPDATRRFETFVRVQVILDWIALAVLIALTGGAESPTVLFFLFHITIASLLLPDHLGIGFISLAPLLVVGVAALEYLGGLPHIAIASPTRFRDPRFVIASVGAFCFACYGMAYCCQSIARRLRRRESELSGLYEGVRDITSSLEIMEVLDRIVETVPRVLGCKAAAIRLLDGAGSQVQFAASSGLSERYRDEVPAEYARSMLDQDTLRDGVVNVPDIGADVRVWHPELVRAEGIASMLSVAILGRSGPLGVLRAYGAPGHRSSADDTAYLRAVAAHGAAAIENAKAYQMLADIDRDKSRFLRMTTHELRAPVRVTEGLLQTLAAPATGPLQSDQRELLTRAQRRLTSLHTLIDDLLDLAAGKADMVPLQLAPVMVGEQLREVAERLRGMATEKGLALTVEVSGDELPVWCDPADLDRLVVNLATNAIQYTARGHVDLRVLPHGECMRIQISDTGIGIPAEALPHLFEEFYRAPNAKATGQPGTGLGMAIVRVLVERYAGHISVASQEGTGTTITVDLPADVHRSAPVGAG